MSYNKDNYLKYAKGISLEDLHGGSSFRTSDPSLDIWQTKYLKYANAKALA